MFRHSSVYPPGEGEPMPISARELRYASPALEIHGEKVILTPLRIRDAKPYVALIDYDRYHLSQHGDKTAAKYKKASNVARSIVKAENPFRLRFGIWHGEAMVGSINLEPLENNKAEVGYWAGKEHIGNGYATDALKTLTAFAFEQLGYDEFQAEAVWENEESQNVLKKVGFMETGEVKGLSYINEQGEEANRLYVVYALPRPETGC